MGYFAIDKGPHLEHYGILGMKWGIRRYENPDGTLTEAGKKRYNRHLKNKAWRKQYSKDVKRVTLNTMNPKNHIPHKGIAKEYINGSIAMHPIANKIRFNKAYKKVKEIDDNMNRQLKTGKYSKTGNKYDHIIDGAMAVYALKRNQYVPAAILATSAAKNYESQKNKSNTPTPSQFMKQELSGWTKNQHDSDELVELAAMEYIDKYSSRLSPSEQDKLHKKIVNDFYKQRRSK